jgi:hypothetical protein
MAAKQSDYAVFLLGYCAICLGLTFLLVPGINFDSFVQLSVYLESAKFMVPYVPYLHFSLLDFVGSTVVCRQYRLACKAVLANSKSETESDDDDDDDDDKQDTHPNKRYVKSSFETLVACTVLQFGGTTLTGMLLGQAPSWTIGNHVFPALFLAWWLTFCCPLDMYWNIVSNNETYWFAMGVGATISSGHAVTTWGVDKALYNDVNVHSHVLSKSIFLSIASGTLSGAGGGIFDNVLGITRVGWPWTWTHVPSMLLLGEKSDAAAAAVNRSFLLAVLYFCMNNRFSIMPWELQVSRESGRVIITFIQLLNFGIRTCAPSLDVFLIFTRFARSVLHIPAEVAPI